MDKSSSGAEWLWIIVGILWAACTTVGVYASFFNFTFVGWMIATFIFPIQTVYGATYVLPWIWEMGGSLIQFVFFG